MQMIIDIPEEKYDAIKSNYNTFPAEMKEWGLEAIKNGTPISRELAQALNKFVNNLEWIEKKYAEPQKRSDKE